MILKELTLLGFKNYSQVSFSFDSGYNALVGPNGTGKTCVLDAIYYLAFTKSYFNATAYQHIKQDNAFMMVQGHFQKDFNNLLEINLSLKKGEKKIISKNKKEYERLADHIGLIPLVMIAPDDSRLLYEGSEERRKWFDLVISQYDKNYLNELLKYNRALQQRNALLKTNYAGAPDSALLQIFDEQLIESGNYIYKSRRAFFTLLEPVFDGFYKTISGSAEDARLIYDSQLEKNQWNELLGSSLSKDLQFGYTTCGIHRDDLIIYLNGLNCKKFSSQGQQKTALIALKLAQYQTIKDKTSDLPILLLDDIFDKLDENRLKNLMEITDSENFGQIFITDTSYNRLFDLLEKRKKSSKIIKSDETED